MKLDEPRSTIRALALLLAASIITTCGDDSSSSKDDRGVFGDTADLLEHATTNHLTANAEALASVSYMTPFITDLMNQHMPEVAEHLAQPSCLPEGVGGRVYTINGTTFTSVVDTAVPEYTARFLLFNLSPAGQPRLDQRIGYVDYSCVAPVADVQRTRLQVYKDSTLIVLVDYTRGWNTIAGTLWSSDGADSIAYSGNWTGSGQVYSFTIHELVAQYSVATFEGKEERWIDFSITPQLDPSEPDWYFDIEFWVSQSDEAYGGRVFFYHESDGFELDAACIESGTVSAPTFAPPHDDCPPSGNRRMQADAIQRQAINVIYQSGYDFWVTANALTGICRALAATGE